MVSLQYSWKCQTGDRSSLPVPIRKDNILTLDFNFLNKQGYHMLLTFPLVIMHNCMYFICERTLHHFDKKVLQPLKMSRKGQYFLLPIGYIICCCLDYSIKWDVNLKNKQTNKKLPKWLLWMLKMCLPQIQVKAMYLVLFLSMWFLKICFSLFHYPSSAQGLKGTHTSEKIASSVASWGPKSSTICGLLIL